MHGPRRFVAAGTAAALLALAQVACAQVAAQPPHAAAIAGARESAWKAIGSGQGSGVSVAIMERGEIVYSEAMGVAERAQNRAVDRNTRFNIGSVSKMFAAAAILLLVDEGKVELDAPVVRYVPEFRMADARHRDITVRMLLNHSSGLPGSSFFFGFEPDASMHRMLLDTLAHSRLKHAPGAMSMYCNDGFTLAEIVVERVSGRRFVDFLAARVFAPLGMTDTGPSVGESGGTNVAEYYDAKSAKKFPREVVPVYATGGFASTAEDLCRFGDSLMPGGRSLLSPASLQELLRPQPSTFARKLRDAQRYGELGWDYATRAGGPDAGVSVLGKGGNSGFYSANLQVLPAQRIVIAFLISGRATGDKLTEPILAGLLAERSNGRAEREPARPQEAQEIPAALARYAGYYAIETGVVKVSVDKSRRGLVVATLAGNTPPLTLTYSDGYFRGPRDDMRFYFASVDGSDFIVANIVSLTGYDMVAFQKLAPVRQAPRLRVPMKGQLWLLRNAPPAMEVFDDFKLIQASNSFEELPGYVDFGGVRRIERPDFASMAATAIRDQSDLEIVDREGGAWVRTGNVLRSNARAAPKLPAGTSTVAIGAEGLNEWRAVGAGAVLGFALPPKGRVIVATRDAVLYDSVVDRGEVYAPADSYVFAAGAPGDVIRISAK